MTNSPSNAQSPVYAIYVSCVAALGGKWGQCANLDRVHLCPIFAACHGACVSNFPAHFTT
jgi:hypothetical protein